MTHIFAQTDRKTVILVTCYEDVKTLVAIYKNSTIIVQITT